MRCDQSTVTCVRSFETFRSSNGSFIPEGCEPLTHAVSCKALMVCFGEICHHSACQSVTLEPVHLCSDTCLMRYFSGKSISFLPFGYFLMASNIHFVYPDLPFYKSHVWVWATVQRVLRSLPWTQVYHPGLIPGTLCSPYSASRMIPDPRAGYGPNPK